MPEKAIIVKDLTKNFFLPHERRDTLKEHLFQTFKSQTFEMLKAVDTVSFEIQRGEFVGIIGKNGSGKSTLLKLLSGILVPSSGCIKTFGTISPFLELGVGFQPDLSGRDNVFLYGALLGLSRRQIKELYCRIVEFAELEKFMDQKVKNYSSGMQVRLAFSVAIQADADILLIDEVLAVGDISFQKKCLEIFREFKNRRKTIAFVSHDLPTLREFSDRVIYLDHGRLEKIGEAGLVIDYYFGNIK